MLWTRGVAARIGQRSVAGASSALATGAEVGAAAQPSAGGAWRGRARRHAPFALVFALAVALLTINVTTPWHSLHEDNGLVFMSAAINHIRFGLGYTKGQDYFDPAAMDHHNVIDPTGVHPQGVSAANEIQYFRTGPVQPVLYGHHPPLLALTIAASLLSFGASFWAVRLVPILFTLAALLLFYRLMALLFAARPDATRLATFASALFISFPIAAYYGRNVAHEAPTLCWALGLALAYTRWRRSGQGGRVGWLWVMAGCVALGMGYGWPMLFFAWLLPALDALGERRVSGRLALATAGVGTLVCGLVVAQIAWADGWSLGTLQQAFTLRSTSFGPAPSDFVFLSWLNQILRYNLLDFGPWTWLALPFALLFLRRRHQSWRRSRGDGISESGYLWRRFRSEGLSLRMRVIVLFGLGGLAHILVFREGAYIHDYWQFYLIPFYAAVYGLGGVWLARRLAVHPLVARLRLRAETPENTQVWLLVVFVVLALAMSAPIIFALYT